MDIIEIINELRKQYLTSDNQVLVITLFNDGFMVNRKPRYQQALDIANPHQWENVSEPNVSATVKELPSSPVKVLPVKRDGTRKRVPSGEEVLNGSHTSKWWSRYHFEKNLLTLAFHQLQERFPDQQWFVSTLVARVMSDVMGLKISTAKRHITTALKLDIIVKAKDGANTIIALRDAVNQGGDDDGIDDDPEVDDETVNPASNEKA